MRRAVLLLFGLGLAQVYHPTATLVHGKTEVVVEKTSPDELGLAWIEEQEGGVRFVFYDPPPYRVTVRFGEDARAYAALAFVEQPDEGGGTVALAGGEARYQEAEDRLVYELRAEPGAVAIEKGKLKAEGRRLDYDNRAGLARLAGPVRFERPGENSLKGEAQTLLYRVEEGELWLVGEVAIEQGSRRTLARLARVDEEKGLAYLEGDPVRSTAPGEELAGRRLVYDLESGEIWVLEGIAGKFSGD